MGAGDVLGQPGDSVGERVGVDGVAVEQGVEGRVERAVVRHQLAQQKALRVHQTEDLRPQGPVALEDALLHRQTPGEGEPEGGMGLDETEVVEGGQRIQPDVPHCACPVLARGVKQRRPLPEAVSGLQSGALHIIVEEGDLPTGQQEDRPGRAAVGR